MSKRRREAKVPRELASFSSPWASFPAPASREHHGCGPRPTAESAMMRAVRLDQSLRAPALIHSSINVICALESGGPPNGICDPHGGFASETF